MITKLFRSYSMNYLRHKKSFRDHVPGMRQGRTLVTPGADGHRDHRGRLTAEQPVSGDQAELTGPGGGLGAVGGAELAQDVGHVLFDGVESHHQVVGYALV